VNSVSSPAYVERDRAGEPEESAWWLASGQWFLVVFLVVQFNMLTSVVTLPTSVAFLLLPLLGVLVLLGSPKEAVRDAPVSLLAYALLMWLSISILWSTNQTLTNFTVRTNVVGYAVVLLVVAVLPTERVIAGLLAFARACLMISVAILLTDSATRASFEVSTQSYILGWQAGFIHKNSMGMAFVLLVAVLLVFDRPGWLRRITLIGSVVLVFGSRSATAYGGLLAVVTTYWWFRRLQRQSVPGARSAYVLGTLLLTLTGVVFGIIFAPTVLGLFGKDLTFTNRTDIWSVSWNYMRARPWLGYGLGALWFQPTTEPTYGMDRAIGFEAAHAHNGALDLALQVGIIGVALYIAIFVNVVRRALSYLFRFPDYATWALMVCAGTLVMSVPENNMFGPDLAYLLIMYIVLLKLPLQHRDVVDPEDEDFDLSTLSSPSA